MGYLIVYLAWGCGLLVAIGACARLGVGPVGLRLVAVRRGVQMVVLVLLAALLGSLALPWISGPDASGGGELVLSGWEGLDPLSLVAVVVLCVVVGVYVLRPVAGGDERSLLLRAADLCLLGLVAGNALIQLAHPDGSRLEWGALVSVVVAVALGVTVEGVARLSAG